MRVQSRSAPGVVILPLLRLFVTYASVADLTKKPKAPPVDTGEEPQQGEFHEGASRVLIKVLWAARLCRRDLLRVVNRPATCVAKLTSKRDLMLYRLMGYIASTKHLRMYCWVGASLAQIAPHMYVDSELGGRSTSGCQHMFRGPFICFPSLELLRGRVVCRIPRRRLKWWY